MGSRKVSLRRKRDRLGVIYDILVACSDRPMLLSGVTRRANLGNFGLQLFVNNLVSVEYLSEVQSRGFKNYVTTQLGRDFCRCYAAAAVAVAPLERVFGVPLFSVSKTEVKVGGRG